VRHAVIGTAGHVDHGKTSLVHALTGVQTDRLPEEQRRGITIELGFAPWRIDDTCLVSVIDAPGHRRLVHNMIAGASGIDVVLLVVAADEGVMPQTREHVAACKLLGVERAVIAVTKCDRTDAELAELAGEEARELLDRHGIEASVVRCSAKTGEGLDELRTAVVAAVGANRARRERRRARLGIDRVFTVHGAGTVVTGTLVEGALAVGTSIRVLGGERELTATVRGLHVHGEARERVEAPTRLAVNLGGLALAEVERGMLVTDDPMLAATRTLDVWLEPVEPVRRGSDAALFIGTSRSTARIQPLDVDTLIEGGPARLRLTEPIVARGGDRFVLRGANVDGPSGAVCGGGVILDAHPPRTIRASKRRALLEALHLGDAGVAVRHLAEELAPGALRRVSLNGRLALDVAVLGEAASRLAKTDLKAIGDGVWVWRAALEGLKQSAIARVRAHHEAFPLQPGMELQTLRAELIRLGDDQVGPAAIGELTSGTAPKLVVDGPTVRVAGFSGATSGSAAAATLARVKELALAAKLEGLGENELVEAKLDPKLSRAALASLERTGELIHAGSLWFDAVSVAELATRVRAHFTSHDVLTIAAFKEMTGLARKQTIPLLEHFDRQRLSLRAPNGSDRLRGPNA
jgi:selenocysteine-specific elongation factor